MTPLLTVESITKQFAATRVVKDVSFTVYPGKSSRFWDPVVVGKQQPYASSLDLKLRTPA